MSRESFHILLVGCGQLGSRHLQAVASLPQVGAIEVLDPRPEALRLGQERLKELPERPASTVFRWSSSLKEASPAPDLCIVATQAEGRCRLVKEVATTVGAKVFLLEKIVAQSVAEYEDLLDFSSKHGLSAWVNCKGRAHPSHRHVKENLVPGEPIVFSVVGGNHGLANNGVHMADLFAFFDGTNTIHLSGAHLDPVLHPSKRGPKVFDLSGTLQGYSAIGSVFMLSLAGDHDAPLCFTVTSRRYRAVSDDMMKWMYESQAESNWEWRQVPYEANLAVSNMTKSFAMDILERQRCELPTLEECFVSHRFILSALRPRFNRLLGTQSRHCPVT